MISMGRLVRRNDIEGGLTWTRATSSPKQVRVFKLIAVLDLPTCGSNIETDQVLAHIPVGLPRLLTCQLFSACHMIRPKDPNTFRGFSPCCYDPCPPEA